MNFEEENRKVREWIDVCNSWLERYAMTIKIVGWSLTLNKWGRQYYVAPFTKSGLLVLCEHGAKLNQDIYRQLPELK